MTIDQERDELKQRLRSSKERRDAFVSAYVDETIPFQIRALRDQQNRRWTQQELAERAGMKQERISTLENPNYGSYSLRILKQLAAAFDVALIVRFVPFSELAEWKLYLSSDSLQVPSFEQENYFKETKSEVALDLLKRAYADTSQGPKDEFGVVRHLGEYRQKRQYGIEPKPEGLAPLEEEG